MLTLNDGRSELWQWDTGRTLDVDADCSQVHFSNKVFGRSIDVNVVGVKAIIPDVLLQTDKDLTAWAFVGTPENGYTKISKVFKVNKRNKPADYVFTPPEQTTLQELVERLAAIEERQDPDAIKNAVEDYLEQNPVKAPVQSVNGKTGKVELTAEDVDLTGYATEKWVQEGYQPKGNYLTDAQLEPVRKSSEEANAKVDTLREVVSKFHSNIVETASGETIVLDDSSDMELAGLRIYGKTTQDGTPTPENPVELVSAGASGAITVGVLGTKNLFGGEAFADKLVEICGAVKGIDETTGDRIVTYNYSDFYEDIEKKAIFDDFKPNTQYTLLLYGRSLTGNVTANLAFVHTDGTARVPKFATTNNGYMTINNVSVYGKSVTKFAFNRNSGNTVLYYDKCGIFEGNVPPTDFEPYKGQTLTTSTPNGLPGIPVESGGNYTDENGQQWICDEIDFAKGVYVQRTKTLRIADIINSNFGISSLGVPWLDVYFSTTFNTAYAVNVLSTGYKRIPSSNNGQNGAFKVFNRGFTIYDSAFTDAEQAKQRLIDMGVVFLVVLGTPIETPLSAEELAQYATLHTNYPNTTIYNDAGAYMEVKYVADTKSYIDKKFAELAAAIVNS